MTSIFRGGTALLAGTLALASPAGAAPVLRGTLTRPQNYDGFLRKLFHPKIDPGKTVRALTYPVKKATVNGGKAAAGAAATYYLSSKKPGIAQVLPKK